MAFATTDMLKYTLQKIKNYFDEYPEKHVHYISSIKTSSNQFLSDSSILTTEQAEQLKTYKTESQIQTMIDSSLSDVIKTSDVATASTPGLIPRANSNGKIDVSWIEFDDENEHLQLGTSASETGTVDVEDGSIYIKSKEYDIDTVTTATKNDILLCAGGLDYSNSILANRYQSSILLNGVDSTTKHGGNLELTAGNSVSGSTAGSVIITSGTSADSISDHNGNIELNDLYIDHLGQLRSNIDLYVGKDDEDLGSYTRIEFNSNDIQVDLGTISELDKTKTSSFNIKITESGVSGSVNVANSFVVTNEDNKIPDTLIDHTITAEFVSINSDATTIDTSKGTVFNCSLESNTTISITDTTSSNTYRQIILVITPNGTYTVNWPLNVKFPYDITPTFTNGVTTIIKLERVGSGTWFANSEASSKVVASSSGSANIEIDTSDLPSSSFTGNTYIQVLNTVDTTV